LILSFLLGWGFHYLTKDLYASISLAIVSIFPIQFYYYYKHEKNDLYPDKLNNFRRKVLIPRIEKDLGAKGMDFNHFQEYLYIHLKDEKYFSHSKLVDFLYERKI
ncbi:MAG: hypothetical protein KDK36_06845, partial [Leptospiraceae bacterium]|nr:hypothetical protein [Leptospiraceae bacterium]